MSNPKVAGWEAALTLLATATATKIAAFDYTASSNVGLIPDLPFYDKPTKSYPLVEFVALVDAVQTEGISGARTAGLKKDGGYQRPPIFNGNYPNAPANVRFGAVSVLAGLGKWIQEHRERIEWGTAKERVFQLLGERPLYLISYADSRQENINHHLVSLATTGYLHRTLRLLWQITLPNVEDGKKYTDPSWIRFKHTLDRFLRFFNQSTLNDLLAQRANYPPIFQKLFKTYFMEQRGITAEVLESARAYGRRLNYAAYVAASEEVKDDKTRGNKNPRKIQEYKNRVLVQFEGVVRNSKTVAELFGRLATMVGRTAYVDFPSETNTFIREANLGSIEPEDVRNLILTYMRLSDFSKKESSSDSSSAGTSDDHSTDTNPETSAADALEFYGE